MNFIFIGLGILVIFWLISLIIHFWDKKSREKYIAKKQSEKKGKDETPPWQ